MEFPRTKYRLENLKTRREDVRDWLQRNQDKSGDHRYIELISDYRQEERILELVIELGQALIDDIEKGVE